MNAREVYELTDLLARVTQAARDDPQTAQQVRDAIARSGLLDVFGMGGALDVVELLDVGGEAIARARLHELPLADLRAIIATHHFDPDRTTTRWRSATRLADFILARAAQQLAEEQEAAAEQPRALVPTWML